MARTVLLDRKDCTRGGVRGRSGDGDVDTCWVSRCVQGGVAQADETAVCALPLLMARSGTGNEDRAIGPSSRRGDGPDSQRLGAPNGLTDLDGGGVMRLSCVTDGVPGDMAGRQGGMRMGEGGRDEGADRRAGRRRVADASADSLS